MAGIALAHPNLTFEAIHVEHISVDSAKTFAEGKTALESQAPHIDAKVEAALVAGDMARAQELEKGAPLFIFLNRNHGALPKAQGDTRNAIQYDIGNRITASQMRHATFEYDKPSTLFGQFDDAACSRLSSGIQI